MRWPARSLGVGGFLPDEGPPSCGRGRLWAPTRLSFVTAVREYDGAWMPHVSARLGCVTIERGDGTCSIY